MTNPTYKPAPVSIGANTDRLAKFKEKPEDFTEDMWQLAKDTAIKIGACMPQQMADGAFYFYYMGASWEEIASKLNVPMGMVLYTAVHFDWFNKKKLVTSVRAGEKVTRADAAAVDLVTDAIVATAAIYKIQLAEVIKDPANAKNCPMIPKNYKDFMTLLTMLQSLQTKDVENSRNLSSPSINVNIANLPSPSGKAGSSIVEVQNLQLEEESERDRIELMRLLAKAKTQ